MTQPELLFHLDGIYRKVSKRSSAPASLFDEGSGAVNGHRPRDLHPGLDDYPLMQRCLNEQRLFGYMLSGNPLEVLDLHPAARDAVPAAELGAHAGRRVKVFGLQVTERFHTVQKSGRLMKFLTLEDQSGTVDIIFWPDMLDRWEEELLDGGPFEVWGKVTEEWDTFSLEAERVRPVAYTPNLVDFERASARLKVGVGVRNVGSGSGELPEIPATGRIRIQAA
jgi:DNA polymerase III alpha subunit